MHGFKATVATTSASDDDSSPDSDSGVEGARFQSRSRPGACVVATGDGFPGHADSAAQAGEHATVTTQRADEGMSGGEENDDEEEEEALSVYLARKDAALSGRLAVAASMLPGALRSLGVDDLDRSLASESVLVPTEAPMRDNGCVHTRLWQLSKCTQIHLHICVRVSASEHACTCISAQNESLFMLYLQAGWQYLAYRAST
jgi:hypothetical protein